MKAIDKATVEAFAVYDVQTTRPVFTAIALIPDREGPQLSLQPLRGLLAILPLGVKSLPSTATLPRRGCDLNLGLLRLSPAR